MIDRDYLISSGFIKCGGSELTNPIYYKIRGERMVIYSETDAGTLHRTYDGLAKFMEERIMEFKKEEEIDHED